MRFHSAAAFLLAKGFGPSSNNNNEFALDVGNPSPMPGVPSVPQEWGRNLGVLKMTPEESDFSNSVAGAFNNMNEDMQKHDGEALDALRELSDSFRKLAQADLSGLFDPHARNEASPPAQGIAAAEESLDTSAPLAGSTFSPPTNQAFFSDTVAAQAPAAGGAPASYLESLKQSASFSAPKEAAPAVSGYTAAASSSYLDGLHGAESTQTNYNPQAGASYGASYPQATNLPPPPATTYSPPQSYPSQPVAAAGSSYLDAMAGAQSERQPTKSYAPSAGWSTSGAAPTQGGSYLDSIAGSVSMSQQEGSGLHYPTPPSEPPQPESPYMGEPTVAYADPSTPMDAAILQFSPDNEDAMSAGHAPKVETPRVRYVRPDPGFGPDSDWEQPPRSTGPPPVHERPRVGTQMVSGYIPNMQGSHGMDGAVNIPEPKPKTPRPVFSKKVSGIHSDFDEMVNPGSVPAGNAFVPKPTPKAPMPVFAERVRGIASDYEAPPMVPEPKPRRSIAAQRVKDIPDWQNDFAHPTPDVTRPPQAPVSVFAKRVGGTIGSDAPSDYKRPEPPMSVFSQKIRGVADIDGPTSYSRPEPPRSVFSQKIKGTADLDGPQQAYTRPEPPRSVFSQKIKGTADFNGPPPNVPKPEPPRSIFAQKIASNLPRAVAASSHGDFAANGNVPVPNPRSAPQQYEQYGRAVRGVTETPGFTPDYPEAMEAGGIREVPLPDYERAQNHQDRLTNMNSSFMVNPDDRIGRLQDEYLR